MELKKIEALDWLGLIFNYWCAPAMPLFQIGLI